MNSKGLNPDRLYWSQDGAIACGDHAPAKNTDTWSWGNWQAVPTAVAKSENLRCETCKKGAK